MDSGLVVSISRRVREIPFLNPVVPNKIQKNFIFFSLTKANSKQLKINIKPKKTHQNLKEKNLKKNAMNLI